MRGVLAFGERDDAPAIAVTTHDVRCAMVNDAFPTRAALASASSLFPYCRMTSKALLDEILKLPAEERLQLVEEVWDSLVATPESVPVPDWHKAELDRLVDHPSAEPPISWDEARARLRNLK